MAKLDSAEDVCKFVSLLIIDVVAFAGNTLIIIAGLKCKQLRKFSNAFIFNVVIADVSQSVLIIPFSLASVYFGKWTLSSSLCTAVALLKVAITLASVQSLAGISLVRYFYIVKNTNPVESKGRLFFSITFVWLSSFALAVSAATGWGELGFDDGKSACTILFYKTLSHTLVVFTIGLFVPVSIMAFCYFEIIKTLRLQRLKVSYGINLETEPNMHIELQNKRTNSQDLVNESHFSKEISKDDVTANRIGEKGETLKSKRKNGYSRLTHKEYQLLRTVTLVIFVFLLCWFPYVVFNTLRAVAVVQDNNTADTINMWMGYANSAVNPLLYGMTNRQFRNALRRVLYSYS